MAADPDRTKHPDRLRWNERHAQARASTPLQTPADWLTVHEPLVCALPRGRALDVAAGRGRHSLYLSKLGFAVDAVDVSDEALRQLRENAASFESPIDCYWRDLSNEPLPEGPYRLIVDFYYLNRALWGEFETRLLPGGLLIVEVLAAPEGDEGRFRVQPGELALSFPGLEILEAREVELPREAGARRETGGRRVSSIVARRP